MTIKIRGTKVSVSMLFAATVTLLLIYDKSGGAKLGLCAAAFHEFGHLACLTICMEATSAGIAPREISFGLYGVRLTRGPDVSVSYLWEAAIAFAGPAANLLLMSALLAVGAFLGADRMLLPVRINAALAAFNLLPVKPLDGGQILYNLLCSRLNEPAARKITNIAAVCGLAAMTVFGAAALYFSGYNYTVLVVTVYLVVYVVLEER